MKRRKILIATAAVLAVILGILVCAAVRLSGGSVRPTEPVETPAPSVTMQPTTAVPTTEDPQAIVYRLLADLTDTEAEDELFLCWLRDTFGVSVLEELEEALSLRDYDRQLWYDLTGNTWLVLQDLYGGAADNGAVRLISTGFPKQENADITLVFGGDICLADNYLVMEYMTQSGKFITDCIDPKLVQELQSADVAFLNNEFCISDRGAPMAGKAYTFRAKTENTDLYRQLGVDLVSLANNHAYDYGKEAFVDTLDTLAQYGIDSIGGGRNIDEAAAPQYYLIGGRKIAFVAATRAEKNIMTPEATADSPGVLRCYDTERFLQAIREAEDNSDFVVACVHWGTEYSEILEPVQEETAKLYIDAGADLIIGAHAHQLQGIDFYNGKAIFYNLGNFWFNSYDIDTGLVKAQIGHDGQVQYTFLPARQKNCVTSWEFGTESGMRILQTLREWSSRVNIDENGVVTEK